METVNDFLISNMPNRFFASFTLVKRDGRAFIAGRIIMQKAVEVREGDTPEVLQKRIMEEAEWKILPLSCEKICAQIIKEA